MTTRSPAKVVADVLIAARQLSDPVVVLTSWPCYVSAMPDTPDNTVAIYDTPGYKDGREMGGSNVYHPGVQIRVRAATYAAGWAKMQALHDHLQSVANVTSGDAVLAVVTFTDTPLHLGVEQAKPRRDLFTLNAVVSIK